MLICVSVRLPFVSSLDKKKFKPLQLLEAETDKAIGKVCSFLWEVISTTANFRKNAFDLIPPEKKKLFKQEICCYRIGLSAITLFYL